MGEVWNTWEKHEVWAQWEFPDQPSGFKHEKTEGVLRNKSRKLERTCGLSMTKSQRAHRPPEMLQGRLERSYSKDVRDDISASRCGGTGFQGFLESPKHEKTWGAWWKRFEIRIKIRVDTSIQNFPQEQLRSRQQIRPRRVDFAYVYMRCDSSIYIYI